MEKEVPVGAARQNSSHGIKHCSKAVLCRIPPNVRAYAKISGKSHIYRALCATRRTYKARKALIEFPLVWRGLVHVL